MARVNQIMHPSQKELFFTPLAVIVEGDEDVAYISTQLHLSKEWNLFRNHGCHLIIGGGKNNQSRFVAIAQEIGIPVFVVFDGDGRVTDPAAIKNNRKDNGCILRLLSISDVDPLPKETMWHENVVMWATKIADSVRADFGESAWNAAQRKVRDRLELQGPLSPKNKVLIAGTLEELWKQGKKSASLIKLCGRILAYAQKIKV